MDDDFELVDEFDAAHSSEEDWSDEFPSKEVSQLFEKEDFVVTENLEKASVFEQTDQVRCGWLGVKDPVKVKSGNLGSDGSWDRVSLISLSAISECSLNSVANEIIKQNRVSYDEKINAEEECEKEPEVHNPKKKLKKKKKKKTKQKVVCGLILFRNNGAEVALVQVKDHGLCIMNSRMRKGEAPLETAARSFREATGLVNEQKIALLPHVIQKLSDERKKLNLMFPAITARKLEFSSEREYEIQWWPSDVVSKGNKQLAKIVSQSVREAMDLLHRHADELPTLVNDEIAEMSEMASMALFEHAQQQKKGITIQETRDFLCRNQDDLKIVVSGCSKDVLQIVLRKLVLQLPGNSGIVNAVGPTETNNIVAPPSSMAQSLLKDLELVRNKKDRVSWSKLADLLEESPLYLTDERILTILVCCGYNVSKQKFSKENKENREETFIAMLNQIC